jgi:hypothetical protein
MLDVEVWEGFVDLALFDELLIQYAQQRPPVRKAVQYARVIREICNQAISQLGDSRLARAAAELYGVGAGPSDTAIGKYADGKRNLTDLFRREIAAAEAYGEISPNHFRQQVARRRLIPELARAILDIDHANRSTDREGMRISPVVVAVADEDRTHVRALLTQRYHGLPKLDTLIDTILPDRPPFADVSIRYTLMDAGQKGEYRLRSSFTFSAVLSEYVLALTTSAVTADILACDCPRISDFYTCSDTATMQRLRDAIDKGQPPVVRLHENEKKRTVQTQLSLSLLPPSEVAEYLRRLPIELHSGVVLYRAQIADSPELAQLKCIIDSPMQKSDHYCYWVADRPMYLRELEFDTATFTTTARGFTLQPFFGSLSSAVENTSGVYRMSLDNWITAGQGAMLVW